MTCAMISNERTWDIAPEAREYYTSNSKTSPYPQDGVNHTPSSTYPNTQRREGGTDGERGKGKEREREKRQELGGGCKFSEKQHYLEGEFK